MDKEVLNLKSFCLDKALQYHSGKGKDEDIVKLATRMYLFMISDGGSNGKKH